MPDKCVHGISLKQECNFCNELDPKIPYETDLMSKARAELEGSFGSTQTDWMIKNYHIVTRALRKVSQEENTHVL